MPTITEKLKAEEHNQRSIRLWPEGLFFVAYERSAYLFLKHVRTYELRRVFYKNIARDVVSIGFPKTVIDQLGLVHVTAHDGTEVITLDTSLDEQQFLQWRDSSPLSGEESGAEVNNADLSSPVIQRLREFNLAMATPLDCMMLVSELQTMLRSYEQ